MSTDTGATTASRTRTHDHKGPLQHDLIHSGFARTALALLRIYMGWMFLWAFIDKSFGLGYATARDKAWLKGGSPTAGFLKFAVNPESPLAGFFKGMVGNPLVDWLFMLGLLGIGLALVLGLATRFAAICGIVMVAMMWLAAWPVGQDVDWAAAMPKEAHTKAANNPFSDDHWTDFFALLALAATYAGDTLGLGKVWRKIVGNGILR